MRGLNVMKRLFIPAWTMAGLLLLASCSCGVFREEYTPAKNQRRLTYETVKQIATAHGFTGRPNEPGLARFQNAGIELLYNGSSQLVVVRSSLCSPFSNSKEWQARCESLNDKLTEDFKRVGIPLRKLSTEEQISRNRSEASKTL